MFFNEQLSKDEYEKRVAEIDLGSYKIYTETQQKVEDHWGTQIPRAVFSERNEGTTGVHIFQCKNVKDSMEVSHAEDSRFLLAMLGFPVTECYDCSFWGENLSRSYEGCAAGGDSSDMHFCYESGMNLIDAEYCKDIIGGSHVLGSVSVKKSEYVILNKRYSKEEYEELAPKIKRHMDEMPYTDKGGRVYKYGEFFPTELSPFAYNETVADDLFPLSKEEVEANGYRFREPAPNEHPVTLPASDLPDHIKDAPENITSEVVGCTECERGFRIVPAEVSFLKARNLPLPRRCPMCRLKEKYRAWIKNLRTFERVCDKCGVNFVGRYPKEEAPRVFCKECYKREYN